MASSGGRAGTRTCRDVLQRTSGCVPFICRGAGYFHLAFYHPAPLAYFPI